jgi:ABC-2 type transport system ATP-binding protein
VAITPTPPLAFLQQLPIIGPMLVTPIVALIHQIPLIGDVLHPWLGYPVQLGLPAGTPTPQDVKVQSFDGTWIYVHFFPAYGLQAGEKAPTILDGPGLGLPGSTNLDGQTDEFLPNDVIGIAPLRSDGYNVVTWDPRGEWYSSGQLEIDSPAFEARDVSTIISWLATKPEVDLNSPGDPRIGMVGASYGGGIQLVSAAIDPRIDAIVPTIAWHSLNTSLYKDQAFKSSWGTLLEAALTLTLARPNPQILPAAILGDLTGLVSPADQDLLSARGPGDLVNQITAPTLLIQGTVDTLFTLAEADANAKALINNGVDTKVLWFCGGHGACLTSFNNGDLIQQRTLEWLDRYVKGDASVTTGPQFEWVDQHGQYFSSNTYPVKQGTPIDASSTGGTLPLLPLLGGSGPQLGVIGLGPIGALLGLPSGAAATDAINLTIPAAETTRYVVGAPELTLTYSGTGTSRHVYAQLVDDTTGLVLGNLVTPVPVTLDGQEHTVTVPMEMVAQMLAPGETVTLQLVASAFPYETIWTLGVLNVAGMELSLPTADAAAISPESAAKTTIAA